MLNVLITMRVTYGVRVTVKTTTEGDLWKCRIFPDTPPGTEDGVPFTVLTKEQNPCEFRLYFPDFKGKLDVLEAIVAAPHVKQKIEAALTAEMVSLAARHFEIIDD